MQKLFAWALLRERGGRKLAEAEEKVDQMHASGRFRTPNSREMKARPAALETSQPIGDLFSVISHATRSNSEKSSSPTYAHARPTE